MLNIAVFGAGGLGKSMARLISVKRDMKLVCILDSNGYAFDLKGIDYSLIENAKGAIGNIPGIGTKSTNSIDEVLSKHALNINAIFVALPNLPNSFIPEVAEKIALSNFEGVIVDALKRTSALELLSKHDDLFKQTVPPAFGAQGIIISEGQMDNPSVMGV